MTKYHHLTKQALLIALAICVFTPKAFAPPLSYQGNSQDMGPSNAQPGQTSAVQVQYGTNYETQFSPYASFMTSPYSQGPAPVQYAGSPGMGQAGAPQQGQDPYFASEVSPYSHYSPYIEIIGEGSDYTLGIDDVVTIIVRNQPDFSGRFVIDPEGNVQYNFVGDVKAVGKTKEQLKAELVERLREYVRYPEVAVMISEYRSKAVYVFGYVSRPGKYAMKGDNITVKEAVVAAGLIRADGSLKRVYVIRPSEFTDSGNASEKKIDLSKLLEKGDSAEDFFLEPGDTILVKQRYFDKFVNAFSRITGPLFQAASVYELGWGNAASEGGYFRNAGNNNN
ncbi:MAG: polysaccharide biosynthesis/export family protein [Candidatus Omnitrophota bacterium]|nr:polysaccharide biosynthesis/export family protein [Candidatus Omnitrophota bacterium]